MQRKKAYSIGEALERYLAGSPLADGMRYARVCSAWNESVGDMVARRCSSFRFEKSVFTVAVNSSVLRMQLEMSKEDIRRRMNADLGEELVAQIVLR